MKTLNDIMAIPRITMDGYDPSSYLPTRWEGDALDFLERHDNDYEYPQDENMLFVVLRPEWIDETQLRVFASWCANEALRRISDPDDRAVRAAQIIARHAAGQATDEELAAAHREASEVAGFFAVQVAEFENRGAAAEAAYSAAYRTHRDRFNGMWDSGTVAEINSRAALNELWRTTCAPWQAAIRGIWRSEYISNEIEALKFIYKHHWVYAVVRAASSAEPDFALKTSNCAEGAARHVVYDPLLGDLFYCGQVKHLTEQLSIAKLAAQSVQ